MSKWIQNFITHFQAMYPQIAKTPVEVLFHFLFVNGNGYRIKDGVPLYSMDEKVGLRVPIHQVFADMDNKDAIIEQLNRYAESEIEKECQARCALYKISGLSDEEIYKRCYDKFHNRYDNITWVENPNDLTNVSYFLDLILNAEYRPYLSLSSGYFLADKFNNNTNAELLMVTMALADAYIIALTKFIDGEVDWKEPTKMPLESWKAMHEHDISMLKDLINRLTTYLSLEQ